ncbi:MAG: methyltransferase domain-containing protein [Myxococcales bacterium FL481]|nr:MAG: methyltransferase domain-containing protein [Myxococcales bacterium FL481]
MAGTQPPRPPSGMRARSGQDVAPRRIGSNDLEPRAADPKGAPALPDEGVREWAGERPTRDEDGSPPVTVVGGDGAQLARSRVPEGQPTPRLAAVERSLHRHRAAAGRAPLVPERLAQLERVVDAWRQAGTRVVLDLGCGTGWSTQALAERHLGDTVIGVDKSSARLARGANGSRSSASSPGPLPTHRFRCDIEELLAFAHHRGLRAEKAYLLYPNPWAKTGQLTRRLYARPAVLDLVAVCKNVEVRTNWWVYAVEAEFALRQLSCAVERHALDVSQSQVVSPFERKYAASGHRLWQIRAAAPPSRG